MGKLSVKNAAKIQNSFTYLYDFGDGWQHSVEIENELEADPNEKYPLCVGGEYAAPPEDVGGIGGFAEFKEAIANKKHPRHREMRGWYAETNFNRTFVENGFDIEFTNLTIGRRQKISKKPTFSGGIKTPQKGAVKRLRENYEKNRGKASPEPIEILKTPPRKLPN